MKALKITVLPVILLSLLMMGGCVTVLETKITEFHKISSSESKKISLSLPVVVEKDMETKKNPDAAEKTVAGEVYTDLKKNLTSKGLLSGGRDENTFSVELKVHYVNRYSAGFEYSTALLPVGGQIIITRVNLKKNAVIFAQIDSFNHTGTLRSREPIVQETTTEIANQIEKILKEGVNVGKSP